MSTTSSSATGGGPLAIITPLTLKALARSKKIDLLREHRLRPTHCPSAISLLAADVLSSGAGSLGDEQYTILEQYLIASCQCGHLDQASRCLATLTKQFGTTSVRVRKLAGLLFEAQGNTGKAKEVYLSIQKQTPSDPFVVKRAAAMAKREGKFGEAIGALEGDVIPDEITDGTGRKYSYLAVYPEDDSVMRELVWLHYMNGNLAKAVFYAEECILVAPMNFLYHTRHAELCYAAGELEKAASAFAHSLTLNEASNNLRAAYGLWGVARELSKRSQNGTSNISLEESKSLRQWAAQRLKSLYHGSPLQAVLELTLQRGE